MASRLARIVAGASILLGSLSVSAAAQDTAGEHMRLDTYFRSFVQVENENVDVLHVRDRILGRYVSCAGSDGQWQSVVYDWHGLIPVLVDKDSRTYESWSEYCTRQKEFYDTVMNI